MLSGAFGRVEGDSAWFSNVDLVEDGAIGIFDALVLARNLRKTVRILDSLGVAYMQRYCHRTRLKKSKNW